MQMVKIDDAAAVIPHCPFCGVAAYGDADETEILCEHVIFIAADDDIQLVAPRFADTARAQNISLTQVESPVDTQHSQSVLERLMEVRLKNAVVFALYMPMPVGSGTYVGFAL